MINKQPGFGMEVQVGNIDLEVISKQFLKAMEVDEIKGKDLYRDEDLGLNPGASNTRNYEEGGTSKGN